MHPILAAHLREIITVTDEQLELILSHFHPLTVPKHQLLVQAGQHNAYMHFILEGCIRFYFIKEDGQESTRHFGFERTFATGLSSFISQEPSIEYLQALEDCKLLRISRTDFYYLLNVIPAWEKFFRHYLEFAYMNNLHIYQREVTKDSEQRYKELLESDPQIVQRIPNRIVASYLNMSPETLSRMKGKVRRKNDE